MESCFLRYSIKGYVSNIPISSSIGQNSLHIPCTFRNIPSKELLHKTYFDIIALHI